MRNSFRYLYKSPATMMIHIALVIIVAGAMITHFSGITGKINLSEGGKPLDYFTVESGTSDGRLPFSIVLDRAEPVYYPATTTPKDYISHISAIFPDGTKKVEKISMNNIAIIDGWRFYQSGMGDGASTLSISHDPVGIAVTYSGYGLLILSIILFFFQPNSAWRGWVRKLLSSAALLLMIIHGSTDASASELPALQKPLARNFGNIYVYWNDRISPIQTMAVDVTVSLYGSSSYKGMTPEQVLTGWLFYYDDWKRDFDRNYPASGLTGKKLKRMQEKQALISWLGTGDAFRIYPYRSASGNMEWLSLVGRRPSKMSMEQWEFMTSSMSEIASNIAMGRNVHANENISALIEGQKKYAGSGNLPDDYRIKAEKFYNSFLFLLPVAILLLASGLLSLTIRIRSSKGRHILKYVATAIIILSLCYLCTITALRGYISGHIPLSNGFETMLFMSVISLVLSLISLRGIPVASYSLLIVAGASLAVAVMGDAHPRIGSMMPVLDSSLLSIHVMIVMVSYSLFFLMAILAAKFLLSKHTDENMTETTLIRVLLPPALFLLTAGIFIGAVWANQSWGRYWGWDPKETCALITMLIYAFPVHARSIKAFRKERTFSLYILVAFASVLFTYFGANYLLPGLHSYA